MTALVELIAIGVALSAAGLLAGVRSERFARSRRRARGLCASCGRAVLLEQPTCDCE